MPPTKKPNKPNSTKQLNPSLEWSLDELEPHVPSVSDAAIERVGSAIRSAQAASEFAALGARFTTEDILASVPPFVVGVLLALRKLDASPPGYAPALLPLLIRETRELARSNAAYENQTRTVASKIAGRREQLKVANSNGLRMRGALAKALTRVVLPKDHLLRAEVPRAAAVAKTPASTAASVRRVAAIAEQASTDPTLAPLLRDFGYDTAYFAQMRALADRIDELAVSGTNLTPPQAMDQSQLDMQDGMVLTLVRAIYWPFRDAYDAGAAISVPPVGPLTRLVGASTSSANDDEDGDEDLDEDADPSEPTPTA